MISTETVLTAIATYLAKVELVQCDENASYKDNPELPAVLFGDDQPRVSTHATVPDTACVLRMVATDDGLATYDVSMTLRATGISPLPVENLADAIYTHFDDTLGPKAWTYVGGSATAIPAITLTGGTKLHRAQLLSRGVAEQTSPANHRGSRWMRTDTWRLLIH
ncbi:hypothetical protein B1R94_07830 [Mycolicibacterium litorale]|nr:hypothetical protein B1R94_07830 [Mycolicibacterium litorale]